MGLIDSHVNLHAEAFAADLPDVIARARAAGVARMVAICDRLANLPAVLAIADAHPDIYASVGAHPHHAKDHTDLTVERLRAAAAHPKVAAIGETGLDLHYNYSPLADQRASLDAHIAAAQALDLPLILHTREADALMAETLEAAAARAPLRALLHCYTGGLDLARRALALGAHISFSGIIAFKNAHAVREIAAQTPLDRLILETDCPYLAPPPHRGRRNEPAFIADIYQYVAALRGLETARLVEQVADNFHRLFRTIPRGALP